MPKNRLFVRVAPVVIAAALVAAPSAQSTPFFPLDEVRPGMVAVGKTVFVGEAQEEFRAQILGVLRNVLGPRRDIVLARLEGGPLARTGVIQGMSGSPVYIDGRLVGAVSYALGSFAREPIAGITPIAEMIDAVERAGPRVAGAAPALDWSSATPAAVYAALGQLIRTASAPMRHSSSDLNVVGPAALAELVPTLRPIGAAMMLSGFDPDVERDVRRATDSPLAGQNGAVRAREPAEPSRLKPGDPVGMSLIRGDMSMGATGTVTHVDGARVYAFGHPFLNLGPTSVAMTRAHVHTVLPSLDVSMKIASMGDVIGTVSQDRATAIGGTLGPGPREVAMSVTLSGDRQTDRRFTFSVLQDPQLTALFTYVAAFNTLVSYQRQTGVMSVQVSGTISFGTNGEVAIDDFFTGDNAAAGLAASLANPVGQAITNDYRQVMPEKVDVHLRVSERQESAAIERVWLDTVKPRAGATHNLHVLLRDFRGGTETISLPVKMPAAASGTLTLVVADAPSLANLEQRDLSPAKPASWPALLTKIAATPRQNRVYVRLLASNPGTVVAGETLSGLPQSVRSVIDGDATVGASSVSKSVLGAWEHRMNRMVRGSRELSITLARD
jgi:hypothetical protein